MGTVTSAGKRTNPSFRVLTPISGVFLLLSSLAQAGQTTQCGDYAYTLPDGFEARDFVNTDPTSLQLNVPPEKHTEKEQQASVVFCIQEKNTTNSPYLLEEKQNIFWRIENENDLRYVILTTNTATDNSMRMYYLRLMGPQPEGFLEKFHDERHGRDHEGLLIRHDSVSLIEMNAQDRKNHTFFLIRHGHPPYVYPVRSETLSEANKQVLERQEQHRKLSERYEEALMRLACSIHRNDQSPNECGE